MTNFGRQTLEPSGIKKYRHLPETGYSPAKKSGRLTDGARLALLPGVQTNLRQGRILDTPTPSVSEASSNEYAGESMGKPRGGVIGVDRPMNCAADLSMAVAFGTGLESGRLGLEIEIAGSVDKGGRHHTKRFAPGAGWGIRPMLVVKPRDSSRLSRMEAIPSKCPRRDQNKGLGRAAVFPSAHLPVGMGASRNDVSPAEKSRSGRMPCATAKVGCGADLKSIGGDAHAVPALNQTTIEITTATTGNKSAASQKLGRGRIAASPVVSPADLKQTVKEAL